VRKLAQADRILGEGKDVADVRWELGLGEQTLYPWRIRFGGLKADDPSGSRTRAGERHPETAAG
jgi:putative transposase